MRTQPLVLLLVLAAACKQPEPQDSEPDTTPLVDTHDSAPLEVAPGAEFDRFCGDSDWETDAEEAVVEELNGNWNGSWLNADAGTLFTMKVIPPHPFQVTGLRIGLAGQDGPIKLRLVRAFGRTYPDLDRDDADLITPLELTADITAADALIELPIADPGVFLEPTQHYVIVLEQQEGGPGPTTETIPDGEHSRALLFLPGDINAYGINGNFRLALTGRSFCRWDEGERLFGEVADAPWSALASARIGVLDANGDGHEDILGVAGGPVIYPGDGTGSFAAPVADAFPAQAASAAIAIFADLDADGDQDAFAGPYVGEDDDGDGWTKAEGDCDDTNVDISPRDTEEPGNGRDDDCDGIADDGLDEGDADGDGWTILAGDCDDTCDSIYPDAPEVQNDRDDDCDLSVDEDFVKMVLLNDGTGHFSVLPDSGLEVLDQSTAAGFGDGNGDGNLDIYWGNWLVHYPDDPAVQGRYFEGNGDGTFVDARDRAGLTLPTPWSCYGVLWNDYNDDGAPDIYVGNYHLYDNQLWQNQGDGTFVDVAPEVGLDHDDIPSDYPQYPGGHTYGGDFGDVDNDGDVDAYICNLAHPRTMPWSDPSMFELNTGAPDFIFEDHKAEAGFIYDEGDVNATFADYDNDMDLDLAIASLYTGHYSRLYRNEGDGTFTDVTYEANVAVHDAVSVVWADVDEDGDLDLLQADRAGAPYMHLHLNRVGQDNHWIELDLVGTGGNRDAIGARVDLVAGGVTQRRDVRVTGGQGTNQTTRIVHFGLGGNTAIDTLTVRWPWGEAETITGLAPDHRYRVVQGSGVGEEVF